jgi:hypothetical protein
MFKTAYILLSSTATCFSSFWPSSGGFYRNMYGQEYRDGGNILFLEESGFPEREAVSPRCFPTFPKNVVPSTSRVGVPGKLTQWHSVAAEPSSVASVSSCILHISSRKANPMQDVK